jgi:hypothetical protein
MGTIVTAIVDGVLKFAFDYLSSVMEKRGLIRQGMAAQAAAETAASEAAQARMGQATADAPQTKDEALARFRDGTA